jgi:ADP-heptose:LPS heptosyltransferase
MRICEKKNWSTDNWKALSEDAQQDEIAWHEYQSERKKQYLDALEKALPRDMKSQKINSPEAFFMILLKRLELL